MKEDCLAGFTDMSSALSSTGLNFGACWAEALASLERGQCSAGKDAATCNWLQITSATDPIHSCGQKYAIHVINQIHNPGTLRIPMMVLKTK
jgi:hypothetical protein